MEIYSTALDLHGAKAMSTTDCIRTFLFKHRLSCRRIFFLNIIINPNKNTTTTTIYKRKCCIKDG